MSLLKQNDYTFWNSLWLSLPNQISELQSVKIYGDKYGNSAIKTPFLWAIQDRSGKPMTLGLIPARAGEFLFSLTSSLVLNPIQLYPAVKWLGFEAHSSHLPSNVVLQGMHRDNFTLLSLTSSAPGSSSPAILCLDFLWNRQGGEVAAWARG